MKKFVLKDLNDFLSIADSFDTPLKFFFMEEEELEAVVHLRTFLLSWKGEKGEDRIKILEEHGFKEAKEEETRRYVLEDFY